MPSRTRLGWISAGALGYVCERLRVPPAEAYGVAESYALLSTRERPPRVAHLCDDIVCRNAGADALADEVGRALEGDEGADVGAEPLPRRLRARAGRAAADRGRRGSRARGPQARPPCSRGCAARRRTVPTVQATARTRPPRRRRPPSHVRTGLRLLRRVGLVDPVSLEDYPRARRLRGAASRAGARAAMGDRRVDRLEAARARRRGVPGGAQVGRRGERRGATSLRRLQRRRVRAGHVQGPRADGARPLRADRGR